MYRCCVSLLFCALLSVTEANAGQWPEKLKIAVAIEDDASLSTSVAKKTLSGIQAFLNQSPHYTLVPNSTTHSMLGFPVHSLPEQCEENLLCWQGAVEKAGVDVLLHVEIGFDGSREKAWLFSYTDDGPLRSTARSSILPKGGGAPLEALQEELHSSATIRIALEDGTTHLQVNGTSRLIQPKSHIRINNLPPGKHEIVIEGLGLKPRIEILTVFPARHIDVPLRARVSTEEERPQKWWGAWASGALLIGAIAAICVGFEQKGSAWR